MKPEGTPFVRSVGPTAWTGETAVAVGREGASEGLLVMQYLMTGPHSHMLGLYRIPVGHICGDTLLTEAQAWKGLRACIRAGFCQYDEPSRYVWVPEYAQWQIGGPLKPDDKRCKGVQRAYMGIPDNPFLGLFFDRYAQSFHLPERREPKRQAPGDEDLFGGDAGSPFEGPSKPVYSTSSTGPGLRTTTVPRAHVSASADAHEPAREDPPGERRPADVPAPQALDLQLLGTIAERLKGRGMMINPGHEDFRALLTAGATWDEFEPHVERALEADQPFTYLVGMVVRTRQRAARRGPLPPAPPPRVNAVAEAKRSQYAALSGGLGAAPPPAAPTFAQGDIIDMENPHAVPRIA